MLYKNTIASLLLLAGTLSLAPAAHAARPGFYYGIGVGQGNDVVLDQTQGAAKLFGGFNLNRFLGMEVAYVNLGSNYIDYNNNYFTQDGISYEVVGYLPISPYLDLFGKVGLFSWTVSDNYYYASATGVNDVYGFGLSTRVSRTLWVRGEYQRFLDVAGGDVNLASVSLSVHF